MTILRGASVQAPIVEDRLLLLRAAALGLAGVLDELVDTLVGASHGEVAWLRALAVVSVEVEFSVRHRSHVDANDVAAACQEASDLLTAEPGSEDDFASRYARARTASIWTATLHKRAIVACRDLALRLSWERSLTPSTMAAAREEAREAPRERAADPTQAAA
jgi:hypothetical protein